MANSTTQFGGFLTNVGVAQQANSAALGLPWNITHMLIGDAGGEPSVAPDPTPKPTQSGLVRQVHRAQLNALFQSPADPAVLVAELVLPPEIGGWWIRELGLEDAAGNFVAVAKPPPSYKPLLVQGSGRTQTIRMHVVFGNVANISLKIDPSIVLATRDYVDKAREATELYVRNQVKAHAEAADPHSQYLRRGDVARDAGQLAWLGVATGTADALVLKLKSNESAISAYNAGQRFQFQAAAANTGAVTARINGLAAVAVKKAGTAGLVDLVAGDLRAGALYDLNFDGSFFQLGGGVGGGGKAFERFSFVASAGQAVFQAPHTVGSTIVLRNGREVVGYIGDGQTITLGVACEADESIEVLAFGGFQVVNTYTKAEIQALLTAANALPVGAMLPFPRGTVPAGFLEVDGSTKAIAVYPDLAAYLGGAFNTGGEAAGFFRLPDSRGEFLRGWDHGRGVDAGRALGSGQLDAFQGHYHNNPIWQNGTGGGVGEFVGNNGTAGITGIRLRTYEAATDGANGAPRTAAETRPRNLAVMWCIKAWNAPVNQGNIDIAALAAQVAIAVPRNYLTGMDMSVNAASPATTIDVAPGIARGTGAPVELVGVMSGVLQAAGAWSSGVGGNKLDAGARAANSWYHLFLLRKASDGQADLLFSISATAPAVPAGYGLVRRRGAVKTDASGNIVPFSNFGRKFWWSTPPKDASAALPAGETTPQVVLSVPIGVRVVANIQVGFMGTASNIYAHSTDTPGISTKWFFNSITAATMAAWNGGLGMNTSDVDHGSVPFEVLTDLAGAIVLQCSHLTAGFYGVVTLGYTEI